MHQNGEARRSDLTCSPLIRIAYVYKKTKDVVPPEIRKAFETGLGRITERVDKWGPTGINGNMDFFGTIGLWYVWEGTGNPEHKRIAEDYLSKLLTPPRYFAAAGYARDAGIVDMSYEGITRFFCTWGALATGKEIARNALDQSYKLKNYTCLPEPDGNLYGPTNMSARTSADSAHDQWRFPIRDFGAAMITPRALPWLNLPKEKGIRGATARLVDRLNIAKQKKGGSLSPWGRKEFIRTVNYANAYYRPGFFSELQDTYDKNPELFQLPFQKEIDFIEELGDDFISAKSGHAGIILHTGPVSHFRGVKGIKSPWGFGGGQLSAFWSKATGSVILGRRRNSYYEDTHDRYEEWRRWPSHAVSGLTPDGKVVSSARIKRPEIYEKSISGLELSLSLGGDLPAKCNQQGDLMEAPMPYKRKFHFAEGVLTIETIVNGNGKDKFQELYETIPVLVNEKRYQPDAKATEILFLKDGEWVNATTIPAGKVKDIRIKRWGGIVEIHFDKEHLVKLSDEIWRQDQGWMGDAHCRNILIDLMDGIEESKAFPGNRTRYTIMARSLEKEGPEGAE